MSHRDHCPNCGGEGPCYFSSHIKTWWGGGTLYGVCKRCADNHQAMNQTEEEIKECWEEYHRRCGYGS